MKNGIGGYRPHLRPAPTIDQSSVVEELRALRQAIRNTGRSARAITTVAA